jgi:hypothetical protein
MSCGFARLVHIPAKTSAEIPLEIPLMLGLTPKLGQESWGRLWTSSSLRYISRLKREWEFS